MTKRIVIAITLAVIATAAVADERKFSAADVPSNRLRNAGRVVIKNDRTHITAFRFFGNIAEALVNLRAQRVTVRPFGASLFNAHAVLRAPMSPYLSALITEAAQTHGVDPRLIAAVVRQESGGNAAAVSSVGAGGVMQLMPATARFLGVTNVFDARQNVQGGTRYLRTLLDAFGGDLDLALAAYNAGPGAVRKFNGVPPYRETKQYVAAIRATYERSLKD